MLVIGGGPAGLTAAYELTKLGHTAVVYEKDSQVGGISRTVERDGYRFDIGGHRFFTKVKPVEDMWHEVMPEGEFLRWCRTVDEAANGADISPGIFSRTA